MLSACLLRNRMLKNACSKSIASAVVFFFKKRDLHKVMKKFQPFRQVYMVVNDEDFEMFNNG